MKSKTGIALLFPAVLMLLTVFGVRERTPYEAERASASMETDSAALKSTISSQTEEKAMKNVMLKIEIGDTVLTAEFADTEAAKALKSKLKEGSATVTVSNYGGWEKVGDLPWSLPASDVQTKAVPGDIMLYCGNSIVLFYGDHAWRYTKLGSIATNSVDSLDTALGGKETELTLSLLWE